MGPKQTFVVISHWEVAFKYLWRNTCNSKPIEYLNKMKVEESELVEVIDFVVAVLEQ